MSRTDYGFFIIAVRSTDMSLFALAESGLSLWLCVTLERDVGAVRMQDAVGGLKMVQINPTCGPPSHKLPIIQCNFEYLCFFYMECPNYLETLMVVSMLWPWNRAVKYETFNPADVSLLWHIHHQWNIFGRRHRQRLRHIIHLSFVLPLEFTDNRLEMNEAWHHRAMQPHIV